MDRSLLSMTANLRSNTADRPPTLSPDLPVAVLRSRMAELKRWLNKENNLPPSMAPLYDRHTRIQQQFMLSRSMETSIRQPGLVKQTYVGCLKNSSARPLEELTRVSITEMLLRKVHKGQFLLCRVVAPIIRMVGSQVVVEDPAGTVTDLAVYNFPATGPGASQAAVNLLFPIGTIIAIREPLLKLGTQGGKALIRVDSISDIIFLDQNGPICSNVKWSFSLSTPPLPTVDELKKIGNSHFSRGDWLLAVFAYSKGLRLDKDAFLLRLNRAEAYLRLSYHSAALFDAETVLANDLIDPKSRWKALLRAVKALYFQGNYSAARDKFEEAKNVEEDDDESKQWFQRIDKREEELEHGCFDWARLFMESLKSPHIQHIADFRGLVKVESIPGRGGGRGVIATAPVQVGQLLVVEKPFASIYSSDLPEREILLSFNLLTGIIDGPCHAILISKVMERLWGNPDTYDALFNLYAGPDYPSSPVPSAVHPGMSRSFSTTGIQFPFKSEVDIDIMRLESIVSYNAFSPVPLTVAGSFGSDKPSDHRSPSALYLFTSLFNHSCAPNALWTCFGDVIVIRATKPIAEGEEIFIAYVGPPSSFCFKKRQDALRKHFPSECRCELCDQDRADGLSNCERREELMKKMKPGSGSSTTQDCRRLLKQLEVTYSPSRGILRPEMFSAKHRLAEAIRSDLGRSLSRVSQSTFGSHLKETIELNKDALRYAGVVLLDNQPSGLPISTDRFPSEPRVLLIRDFLAIAVNYLEIEDYSRAASWVKAAEWGLQVGLGGDKTLFKLLFGKMLDKIKIQDFVNSVLQP